MEKAGHILNFRGRKIWKNSVMVEADSVMIISPFGGLISCTLIFYLQMSVDIGAGVKQKEAVPCGHSRARADGGDQRMSTTRHEEGQRTTQAVSWAKPSNGDSACTTPQLVENLSPDHTPLQEVLIIVVCPCARKKRN